MATDEDTDLYVIEGTFLNMLFVRSPSLGGRFMTFLASLLATRLKARERKK